MIHDLQITTITKACHQKKRKPVMDNTERKLRFRYGVIMKYKLEKQYPPPVNVLRMHWRLLKTNTNGRLVIRVEIDEQFEFFEADRSNGRFILNLVSEDNPFSKLMLDHLSINDLLAND
ncbi:uncharacterized protein LOC126675081 [Mercurialis annua]|uniref:uncharacterized protein LOC126675081 n=1 Tax=Mercurialis annua TaxID=3986 RepID=UPI00215EC19F|nr:uncharacterized protein LOC126675081 [Mercurialis annua]